MTGGKGIERGREEKGTNTRQCMLTLQRVALEGDATAG